MASQPIDQGAILRSGALLIPNLAEQIAKRDHLDLQRQQVGVQMMNAQRQIAEDAREQATAQSYAADLTAIGQLPANQQPAAIIALMRKYPKQSEALKRSYDAQDDAVKQANFREAGEIYSLIQNGATDRAAERLRQRIEADRAAGLETEDDEAILSQLESGDPAQVQQATATIGWQLSTAAGPDKFSSTFGAINPSTSLTTNYRFYKSMGRDDEAEQLLENEANPVFPITTPTGTTAATASELRSLAAGGGAARTSEATPPTGGGNGVDRGTRNNNPGNLKDGPFARRQPGYRGADSGGFAVFDSAAAGNKAQERLLSGSYLSKGHDTPRKIIARYAPAGENSSASMNNYAAYVARRLGIGVDDKVPAGKTGLLAKAMREFETGKTVRSADPSKPVRVTSKAQFDKLPSGAVFTDPEGNTRRKP